MDCKLLKSTVLLLQGGALVKSVHVDSTYVFYWATGEGLQTKFWFSMTHCGFPIDQISNIARFVLLSTGTATKIVVVKRGASILINKWPNYQGHHDLSGKSD